VALIGTGYQRVSQRHRLTLDVWPCGGRLATRFVEPRGAVQVSPLCPQDDLGRDDVRVRHITRGNAGERPQDHVYFHRPLYQTLRRHETVRRELSHLTDRELANICITRSDIERIASGEARS
jgi:uncharacterized protein YjiS (DUF1127 family)